MEFEAFISRYNPTESRYQHYANVKLNAKDEDEAKAMTAELRVALAHVATFKIETIAWPSREGRFIA